METPSSRRYPKLLEMQPRKRLVLIEDDRDIARALQYNLEKQGEFQVVSCRTGEQGLREVEQNRVDLVLLDLMLPDMDGLAVYRELRSQPATASLPIIMLTARVEERDKLLGLELGADDYITKPFSRGSSARASPLPWRPARARAPGGRRELRPVFPRG